MSEPAKPCKTCGTCPTCGVAPAPVRFFPVPAWPYYAAPWWGVNPPNYQGTWQYPQVVLTGGTLAGGAAGGNMNTTYTVIG